MTIRILLFIFTGLILGLAEDWPAYRGPRGDGISSEIFTAKLPPGGPKLLWRVPTPSGLSSFSVSEGKAFTTVLRTNDTGRHEVCLALDAVSGKELWAAITGPVVYQGGADSGAPGNRGGDGPRSTPTVNQGKVYVYSADMTLTCLEAATGKTLWAKSILKDFSGKNIGWSSAMSPVVNGDLVYVAGGGPDQAMIALNKSSGETAWKTGTGGMTHATPVLANICHTPQILFLMQSGLVALDPKTGRQLWTYSFPYRTSTACSPVIADDVVFVTASYEVGGAAVQVTRTSEAFEVKELWREKGNNVTSSLWSTPVHHKGFLYGMISGKKYGNGPLKCVDLKDASLKWEQTGFGAGNVILSGDTLIALSDDGHVYFAEGTPGGYKQLGKFKAVEGKCWSTPALSNGRLYVRSTKEGACFDLSGK